MRFIEVTAFFAGIISFLSPCIIPMIAIYFSLITGKSISELEEAKDNYALKKMVVMNTLVFIMAFTLVFTLAGAASGQVAKLINTYRGTANIIGGIMIILFALKLLGLFKKISFKISFLDAWFGKYKVEQKNNYFSTFIIGVFFAVSCSHCIAPLLYSMLLAAGGSGSTIGGMTIMFMFSLGLAIPYMFIALAYNQSIGLLKRTKKYHKYINRFTAIIMLFLGVMLVLDKFTLVVEMLYKIIPYQNGLGM